MTPRHTQIYIGASVKNDITENSPKIIIYIRIHVINDKTYTHTEDDFVFYGC